MRVKLEDALIVGAGVAVGLAMWWVSKKAKQPTPPPGFVAVPGDVVWSESTAMSNMAPPRATFPSQEEMDAIEARDAMIDAEMAGGSV